jgi:hypothetical protein
LINEKHFLVKEKFGLFFKKVFFFSEKHFQEVVKKIKNIILFADYIKFGPQTFDCYIFCFESLFFNFIP